MQVRPRLPITPHILRGLKDTWQGLKNHRDAAMLWVVCTMAFFGFLRSGEITVPADAAFDPAIHMTPADVPFDSLETPLMIRAQLKVSKTDLFQARVHVFIGKTDNSVCPVLAYLSVRPASDGPLFMFEDGRALTQQCLVTELRRCL